MLRKYLLELIFSCFLQMVVYEAARSLVNLKNMKSKDLCSAVSGMFCFLSNPFNINYLTLFIYIF